MKPGVPVVIGEAAGELADVFQRRSEELSAPILFVDQDAGPFFALDLAGPHQQKNARTATAAIAMLREKGWRITEEDMARGLSQTCANTGFAGRWQTIAYDPLTIVDVGHNEDGLQVVGEMLKLTPHKHLHIVLGAVNDKDIGRMLAQLPKRATYYFCKANIPRGLSVEELRGRAATYDLHGQAHASVIAALSEARASAGAGDLVLVTGSIFVVAEVL